MCSGEEIQSALRGFAGQWRGYAGSERGEAQTYLNELIRCYGACGLWSIGSLLRHRVSRSMLWRGIFSANGVCLSATTDLSGGTMDGSRGGIYP